MFQSRMQHARRWVGALLVTASLSGCHAMMVSFGGALPRELVERGVAAEAEVVELWDTGWTVNDDPVVGMKVRVHPPVGDSYDATIERTLVSRIATWQFQPGTVIPVRYDPQNPALVAVDREHRRGE
jgi:hypothetical protein